MKRLRLFSPYDPQSLHSHKLTQPGENSLRQYRGYFFGCGSPLENWVPKNIILFYFRQLEIK